MSIEDHSAQPSLSFRQIFLLGFVLGFFISTVIFALWFWQRNKPLDYHYISRPMASVTPATVTVATDNQQTVKGIAKTNLVNINKASVSQLGSLVRIGEVRAQKIIDGRPYQRIEDLVIKKIIPRSVFEGIKGQITVGD